MDAGFAAGALHKNAALRKELVSAHLQNEKRVSGAMPPPLRFRIPT